MQVVMEILSSNEYLGGMREQVNNSFYYTYFLHMIIRSAKNDCEFAAVVNVSFGTLYKHLHLVSLSHGIPCDRDVIFLE